MKEALLQQPNCSVQLGAVYILRQPPEGGEGVWQMLTIADKGGWGQKNVQKKEIMGTENVDKENN